MTHPESVQERKRISTAWNLGYLTDSGVVIMQMSLYVRVRIKTILRRCERSLL